MDIIDSSELGVRAAVLRLRHRSQPLRFTIYPMVHLAEPRFYAAVAGRLGQHDLVVAEGIQGASRTARLLSRTYRLAGGSRRLGLQVQPGDLVDVGVPVVRPDMTGADFEERWHRIGLLERIGIQLVAPAVAVHLRVFGSRRWLAGIAALDDDILHMRDDPHTGVEALVGSDRDALLVQALADIHDARHDEDIDVAIVYGAEHVGPVVSFLAKRYRYVVSNADWLTVFTL